MSVLSLFFCLGITIYRLNGKGYTLMYIDEINEDGDFEIWGVDGFPDNCCHAVKLDDYGNHADDYIGWTSITSTQNIAWTGGIANTDYEQLLLATYSADSNSFQITKKGDSSSPDRWLAMAYVDGSPCSNNSAFNMTALFVAESKKSDIISYGCGNIENGRYHVISEHNERYTLFLSNSMWGYGGNVYDPKTKMFTLAYHQGVPPYAHIIITINGVDGSGYNERLRPNGFMPYAMHYTPAINTGYPAIVTPGGTMKYKDVGGYGVYSLQTKDFELIKFDAPFMTFTPVGTQNYGIAMDGAWNMYKFDLSTGNYTSIGSLTGSGLGTNAAGYLESFATNP